MIVGMAWKEWRGDREQNSTDDELLQLLRLDASGGYGCRLVLV